VAIADGSGGAIVVWLDARDLPTYSLYATRITASGVPEPDWTTTGVRVAVTLPGRDGVIGDLALAPDGLGGSFFTWTDGSNYDSSRADIRAQHLTGAGETATGWPTAGLSLTTAAGDQLNGGLAADGAGGAIATWFDAGGNPIVEDVYASRLSPTLPLPEPPPPKSFAVIAVAPNPTDATSTILFDLPAAAPVRAEVYDATGHQVRVLAEGEELPAGRRSLRWDGLGSEGGRARAGLYFVRVSGGGSVGHAKLVRIR
jgi:hypothetical protein